MLLGIYKHQVALLDGNLRTIIIAERDEHVGLHTLGPNSTKPDHDVIRVDGC